MMKRLTTLMAVLGLSGSALAHHSSTLYDREHPVEITGTVKEFRWVNPHSFLYLEVPDATGAPSVWTIEGPSVMMLARNGWTSASLATGEKIRALVAPQKDGTHAGTFMRIFRADGTVLESGRIK
jgi:hypothetical protein